MYCGRFAPNKSLFLYRVSNPDSGGAAKPQRAFESGKHGPGFLIFKLVFDICAKSQPK
jgi:hypothetical protein